MLGVPSKLGGVGTFILAAAKVGAVDGAAGTVLRVCTYYFKAAISAFCVLITLIMSASVRGDVNGPVDVMDQNLCPKPNVRLLVVSL